MKPTRDLTVVTTLKVPAEATHFWGGLLDAPVYLRMVSSGEYNEWQFFDPELHRWCFHSKYPLEDQRQPLHIEPLPASEFEMLTMLEEVYTEADRYVSATKSNVALWSSMHTNGPRQLKALQSKLDECRGFLRDLKKRKPAVRNPLPL